MKGFSKTQYPNLVRNDKSGVYYALARAGKNKRVARSLKTDSLAVARQKLSMKLAEIRVSAGRVSVGNLTMAECVLTYLARKKERGYARKSRNSFKPLKQRSLDYREETIASIRKFWPDFDETRAAAVTEARCQTFADQVRRKYKSTRFNGIIQSLRGILQIAVEGGILETNPASCIGFAEVKRAEKYIPSREEFTEILRRLDFIPSRKFSRLSVRGLAFTGLRPDEARHVEKADVNLAAGTLVVRVTKNGRPRTIQLIEQAIEFFTDEGVEKVIESFKKSPRKSLDTICRDINLPRLTPYTMRHLHMTALIESGIDIGVAADIAGHQDGGVTLLRHYRHSRSAHVREQLKEVIV